MVEATSWGRLGHWAHDVIPLHESAAVASHLARSAPGIAYGMGRSYGDVCLNPQGTLWTTRGMDRFIHFDRESGLLECEAGVLLKDIQSLALASGWMLPVTPGTQFVTVGGALANDVHGKNHHGFGSFGDHVRSLTLVRSDGEQIECGPGLNADWYAATVGGMGLTGIITRVKVALRPVVGPWLNVESMPYDSLGQFFQLADESEQDWEYTVSWIDCLSRNKRRGIFFRANHAPAQVQGSYAPRQLGFPITPPLSLVNRLSLRPFNAAYFHRNKFRAGTRVEHYQPFFYPLDGIARWNRMYGPRGFYQYQCVIPPQQREEAVEQMLNEIARSGTGSFLAVLKTFGQRTAPGLLSFPQPGVTLALDFPNRGDATLALMQRLDAIVAEAGGRLYAAKDARMPRELYEAGYPQLEAFHPFRDPGMSSALSRRLLGS
jgi:FAD/FMN-containing dehydrogenase